MTEKIFSKLLFTNWFLVWIFMRKKIVSIQLFLQQSIMLLIWGYVNSVYLFCDIFLKKLEDFGEIVCSLNTDANKRWTKILDLWFIVALIALNNEKRKTSLSTHCEICTNKSIHISTCESQFNRTHRIFVWLLIKKFAFASTKW